MSAHAVLAPSFAPVWGRCSAAVAAAAAVPERETEQTRFGTAGHWLAAECLERWRQPDAAVPFARDWIGQTAPNGVVVCDKMAEGVQVYIDDIVRVCQQHGGLRDLLIEQRVEMPDIHPQNWGTLDAGLWVKHDGLVYLWDLKLGHRQVDARENLQMVDYAKGLVNHLDIGSHLHEWTTLVVRIVQPFAYTGRGPIDEWRTMLADLRPLWNDLAMAADAALCKPTMTAGSQCRYCPARGRCATARRSAHALFFHCSEGYEIDGMTPPDLALERKQLLAGLQLVKGRLEAVEEELLHQIKQGATDTGLALATGQGREKWTAPDAVVVALCQQFGVDATELGLKSPSQVRKLVAPELRFALTEAVKTIAHKPNTGYKLIAAEDSISSAVFAKQEK